MSGLAEVLDENTALRRELATPGEQLSDRSEQLAQRDELIAKLQVKFTALEKRATHFEEQLLLIEKRRELARAERFVEDQNQTLESRRRGRTGPSGSLPSPSCSRAPCVATGSSPMS